MYACLTFDVEDVLYYPPRYGIDDIPGWLAEIMTDVGVRGSFFVMGEKARLLKERGRIDVIERMKQHSIGSHSQGNVHPLIPEVVEDKGWDDGLEAVAAYEDSVTRDHLAAFGREPVALSTHNAYWAAQYVALAGRRHIPYMYGMVRIREYERPMWYAGTLTFPHSATEMRMPTGLDVILSRDDAFEQQLRLLDEALRDRAGRGFEYVTIDSGHPVRVMTRGWQEVHSLASGLTRTPAQMGWLYAVKSKEEARAKVNFRRYVEFLRHHPAVQIVGVDEAARLFSTQPATIQRDALVLYAQALEQARKPISHSTFSPAELVCALAESLLAAGADGDLPPEVRRRDVLGPKTRPVVGPECDAVTHEQLLSLCQEVVTDVDQGGALPANLHLQEARVGLGQFALLAAHAYAAQARYERLERLRVDYVPRYPDAAHDIDTWVRRSLGEHWALPLDFSCENLAEQARLQTWSLKPAWLHPPQGAMVEGERMAYPR